jgi:uncharacterized protein (TIGR02266 family)
MKTAIEEHVIEVPETKRAAPKPPPLPQKRDSEAAGWEEKRTAPRREVTAQVDFDSESNFYTGFTVDVSTGGLFVVTWSTLPIGTHVNLSFTLQGQKEIIVVEGEVRWVREHNPNSPDLWPGMGIRFVSVPEHAREAIDAFVEAREPLFWD